MAEPETPPFEEIDDEYANAIAEHVDANVGPIANVFHEIVPDAVRVDLLLVPPTDARPYVTLVTCGMSEKPMRVPLENPEDLGLIPELRYAELLLCLPPDWPLDMESFKNEANYWPIRWLKRLARLPHQFESYLGRGHSIPNGDPARPFAESTKFCCWFIDEPVLFPPDLQKLRFKDKVINFYGAVPLYEEEMQLKVRQGTATLNQLLDKAEVSELIEVGRTNAVA